MQPVVMHRPATRHHVMPRRVIPLPAMHLHVMPRRRCQHYSYKKGGG